MAKEIIERAKQLAIDKHKGQMYGEHDYMYHVEKVANSAREYYPNDHRYEVVAYLHDVVEDTDVEIEHIEFLFGSEIAMNVNILTDERGVNRKERKAKTNKKIKEKGHLSVIGVNVKVIDRMENMKEGVKTTNLSKLRMYVKENDDFLSAVGETADKKLIHHLTILISKVEELIQLNKNKPQSKSSI